MAQEVSANLLIAFILLALYVNYLLFFKKNKNGFVRYIRHFLLPFTFGGGFLVYFWGYQVGNSHCNPHDFLSNFFESIFSTTRLFILGNDFVEIENSFKHEQPLFHAMFALTAFLAAFIFCSFFVQVFFKNWMTKSKINGIKPAENHFFYGINNAALSLSGDLAQNNAKRLIVFVNDYCYFDDSQLYSRIHRNAYQVKRKSFFDSINLEKEEGILKVFHKKDSHVDSFAHNEELFYNLKVLRKNIGVVETHLYFMSDDEDWNIKHAKLAVTELDNLIKKMEQKGEISRPVRIHVATYKEIFEEYVTESLKNLPRNISVVVHNYATLVSRQLIEMYHPIDFVGINKELAAATTDFNTLIIGFGQIGTHVLRKLIEQGQFMGSTFHATVIDQFIHSLEGRFEHLYPEVKTNYDIQFVEAEVGHRLFYETIKNLIDKTNYIVITLGKDDLNIQTALEILKINSIKGRKLLRLFIQLEDDTHWKETLKEYKERISIFGESDNVFTVNNILQPETQAQGRTAHEVYRVLYNDTRTFDEISRYERLSNISVADHLYTKVRLLGYDRLENFSAKFSDNESYKNSLTDIQRLNLSIGEHLRWNAFHFIQGWTFLPFDQISGNNPKEKYKNRKDPALKKHACLTTWEDLKELEKVIGKDLQEADIDSVEHLYDFINFKKLVDHAK